MIALLLALTIPVEAARYQRALISNARFVWGLDAPIATMAAQVHQESGWRPDARSPFANGLAQFTPDTAEWAAKTWPDLAANQPFEPAWALRALARYDRWLWERVSASAECDRWAFTLSAYNGGLGWLRRDQKQATEAGADPLRWWDHVERYSRRAPKFVVENRGYPRRILRVLQPVYRTWGIEVPCSV